MNCLDVRRALFAAPRERTRPQRAHLAGCAQCARLASNVAALDGRIASAAHVSVPEALAERVLLRRQLPLAWPPAVRVYAAAAVVLIAGALTFAQTADWRMDRPLAVETLDAINPAAAAIAFVVDEEPTIIRGHTDSAAAIAERVRRLGLRLANADSVVHYVGRCEIAGNNCDHIVLLTPNGKASVILLPDHRVEKRLLVSARRKIALVRPARSGSYVVVGESIEAVKHVEKLLERA